jgi:hypothetical protein
VQVEIYDYKEPLEAFEGLLLREFDVLLSPILPFENEGLEWKQKSKVEVLLLFSSNDPLFSREVIDFAKDLKGYTYLSTQKGTIDALNLHFSRFGITGKHVASNQDIVRQLLEVPKNVFAVPKPSAKLFLAPQLCQREIVEFPAEIGTYFVFRKNEKTYIQHYINYLMEEYPEDCRASRVSGGDVCQGGACVRDV